jgi:hypothetical protein
MSKKLDVATQSVAKKILKMFTGLPPARSARLKLATRLLGKHQVALGRLAYLGYVSDKWDKKTRLYQHDFKRGPRLVYDPQTKLLLIWPAGWKITSRGIVG